jgi:hypothetical protein
MLTQHITGQGQIGFESANARLNRPRAAAYCCRKIRMKLKKDGRFLAKDLPYFNQKYLYN